MTIKVIVEHAQPGYDKDVAVQYMNLPFGSGGQWCRGKAPPHILKPGEKAEFYVHGGQRLEVTEVEP